MRPVGPRPVGPRIRYLVVSLAVLAAAAGLVERSTTLRPALGNLRARTVESSALPSGDTTQILRRLGVIHPLPEAFHPSRGAVYRPRWAEPPSGGEAQGAFRQHYSLDRISAEQVSRVLRVDLEWLAEPVAIVSLLIRPEDLREIQNNPKRRGREWERPGFFSYLEDGELLFASRAGVRLHGGWSRDNSRHASYRIYFRNSYGFEHFTPAIFAGRSDSPPRQLVIRRDIFLPDTEDEVYFKSPMAYEIARRIGCPAPQTQPVAFFLNGRLKGLKALTEYIQLDYLKAYFGHGDFVLVRTKTGKYSLRRKLKEGSPELYRALKQWARETSPLSMEEASQRVDLENLTYWFLSVLFCATDDMFQGALVLDQKTPGARWFWIAWDMDKSFHFPQPPQTGERTFFETLMRRDDLRSHILRRLFSGSREYREYFARVLVETLNHRLTGDFLDDLIQKYEGYSSTYEVKSRTTKSSAAIRAFLRHRHPELRNLAGSYLGLDRGYTVEVRAPAGSVLEIDGYRRGSSYSGWYYENMPITVKSLGIEASPRRWVINGRPAAGLESTLRHQVTSDTTIELVPAGEPG